MADLGTTTIFGDLNVNGSMGGAIRIAYANGNPGATTTFSAYLDTDDTGEEVTVTGLIVDGGDLSAATPRILDGDACMVIKIGGTWYCTSLFFATP